jgi:hypothetical protein
MSNVANAQDLYGENGTGANYESSFTFKAGVNENVYVKDWVLEDNENGTNLRINFYQAVDGKSKDEWSVMSQVLYFPKGVLTSKRLKVLVQSIGAFVEQFVPVTDAAKRYNDVLAKYNIQGFDLEDDAVRNDQLKKLVRGWFDLISPKFNTKGTLVCGYQAPREKDGEVKQYLAVAKYGQNDWWEPPFRTNGKTSVPAAKVDGFKDESDKKYNFWSYTRQETQKSENPHNEVVQAKPEVQEEW